MMILSGGVLLSFVEVSSTSTFCIGRSGSNTGRCYKTDGGKECRWSPNPLKTCFGTMYFEVPQPGVTEILPNP